jgi:hypothetical protein
MKSGVASPPAVVLAIVVCIGFVVGLAGTPTTDTVSPPAFANDRSQF